MTKARGNKETKVVETENKSVGPKENNVDPALVKEIDEELSAGGVELPGTGEQPHVEPRGKSLEELLSEMENVARLQHDLCNVANETRSRKQGKSLTGPDGRQGRGSHGNVGLSRHSASHGAASVFQASRRIRRVAGWKGSQIQWLQNQSG